MHYEIVNESRKLIITPELESALEKELRRLDPLVASFPEDTVLLRVIFNDEAAFRGHEVKLRLSLPGKLLTAYAVSPHPQVAIDAAIDNLRRELIDYKEHLRQDHLYKRKRRTNEKEREAGKE